MSRNSKIDWETAAWLHEASLSGSKEEREKFLRWLKQSPDHLSAFITLELDDELLRTTDLQGQQEVKAVGDSAEKTASTRRGSRAQAARGGPMRYVQIAAGCAIALFIGLLVKTIWFDRTIETAVSEWRRVSLADGSVVSIGPRTRLELDFTDTARSVRLFEGEAYFQVAHEAQRPFLVATEMARLRAVGTAFNVATRKDRLVVTVAHGEIAVSRTRRPGAANRSGAGRTAAEVTLAPGEQALVSKADGALVARRVNADEIVGWPQGVAVFANTRLGEAVAEFNSRNTTQLVVDPQIRDRLLTGTFAADAPRQFAEAMREDDPELVLREVEPGVLRIEMPQHNEVSDLNGG
jgi:transmembrane sensor